MSNLPADLKKAFDHLHLEYAKLQVGRARPEMVEGVFVEAYGSKQPLRNVANVSLMDNQTIKIEPWDKSLSKEIEKGISEANLGLNPSNMGDAILIKVPMPTEERRKELCKVAKKLAEEAKIGVRTARQEALKKIAADFAARLISEDVKKKQEADMQKEVDAANKKLDEMSAAKEKDIMKV